MTKKRVIIFGILCVCIMLLAFLAYKHPASGDKKEVISDNIVVRKKYEPNRENNSQKVPAQSVPTNPTTDELGAKADTVILDELEAKLDADILDELAAELDDFIRSSGMLSEVDLREYSKWFSKTSTSNDWHDFVFLVDITENLAEKLEGQWDGIGPAYALIKKGLAAIENSQLFKENDKQIELQRTRLLILKYAIERSVEGSRPGIDPWQESRGISLYSQLQDLEPELKVGNLQKQAMLIDVQKRVLGSLTNVKPLKTIIKSYFYESDIKDRIIINRTKTIAFIKLANVFSASNDGLEWSGKYYQQALDYIESLPEDISKNMNRSDSEFFEKSAETAAIGLIDIRAKCDSLGLDFDHALKQLRRPIELYRKGVFSNARND